MNAPDPVRDLVTSAENTGIAPQVHRLKIVRRESGDEKDASAENESAKKTALLSMKMAASRKKHETHRQTTLLRRSTVAAETRIGVARHALRETAAVNVGDTGVDLGLLQMMRIDRHKSRSHRERERDRERNKDKDRKRARRDRSSSIVDRERKDSEKARSSRRGRHSRDDHNSRETDGKDDVGFKIKGSKAATVAPTSTTTPFRPPTGPKKDRERDRRGSQHSQASALPVSASPAAADPHTLEREARNRERMLKEEQRRASLSLGKRPHSSVDESTPIAPGSVNPSKNVFDPPTGPKADKSAAKSSRRRGEPNGSSKSRRTSYKYEEEEKDEVRAARVEREREAGRWA
ncbi:hypothetical protein B0A49_08724 [Cryomyces minteri]|uniref:Uncharacterized protein n=1 Tax=Cryomyces minteri TaxID=331657 RepID=A0A4U0WSZ4_9PEZI|nr:hypothetical protein B0A49_08724 [Cryomyces minteri]